MIYLEDKYCLQKEMKLTDVVWESWQCIINVWADNVSLMST